jgi:hypothetical protein
MRWRVLALAAQRAHPKRRQREPVASADRRRQGIQVEKTRVPADAAARMARPLRLLHNVDIQLRKIVATAVAGDLAGVLAQVAPLEKLAGPLNRSFDAVGLRDCGSNQS